MLGKTSEMVPLKGALLWAVSTLLWLTSVCGAVAHEVRPSIADVEVSAETVRMDIRIVLEPLIAGIDLAGLEDTDDSPLSGLYDRLREEAPADLEAALRAAWPNVASGFKVITDGATIPVDLVSVAVPDVGDVDLPRDSQIVVEATLPEGAAPVQVGWAATLGPFVVRQVGGGEDAYTAILNNGTLSAPLPRDGVATESAVTVFVRFVISGIEHIVPKGIDHILFVLGLFFYALRAGPLLWQVTAFTLAHTVTLALASLGLVTVSPSVVEPLIALSIAYVAAENIWANRPGHSVSASVNWARIAVVFGFGLLHGLGFAFVLGDVGLDAGRFVVGLIGFNIGVEVGQLSVIAVAFVLLGLPFGKRSWYPTAIAIPASLCIGAVGLYWTYERVFLG